MPPTCCSSTTAEPSATPRTPSTTCVPSATAAGWSIAGHPDRAPLRRTRMPNPQLDATLSDLLAADFAASPVSATGYGLTEYDDRLDDVSADALRARDADAARFLAMLDAIGDEGL